MHSRFGASSLRVDGTGCAVHNGIVDAILDERRRIGNVEETLGIRLIVSEEQDRETVSMLARALTRERVAPGAGGLANDHPRFTFVSGSGAERRLDEPRLLLPMPAPVLSEPDGLLQGQRRV